MQRNNGVPSLNGLSHLLLFRWLLSSIDVKGFNLNYPLLLLFCWPKLDKEALFQFSAPRRERGSRERTRENCHYWPRDLAWSPTTHLLLTEDLSVGCDFWIPTRNSSIYCTQTVACSHAQPFERLAMHWLQHRRVFCKVPVALCSKKVYSCKQCLSSVLDPPPVEDQM